MHSLQAVSRMQKARACSPRARARKDGSYLGAYYFAITPYSQRSTGDQYEQWFASADDGAG